MYVVAIFSLVLKTTHKSLMASSCLVNITLLTLIFQCIILWFLDYPHAPFPFGTVYSQSNCIHEYSQTGIISWQEKAELTGQNSSDS